VLPSSANPVQAKHAAMAAIGLLPSTRTCRIVRLHGEELLGLSDSHVTDPRQDDRHGVQDRCGPDPVYTIGDQIAEAIRVHNAISTGRMPARELLSCSSWLHRAATTAGEGLPARAIRRRAPAGVIAIAIANDPDLLICDEPTTALDVTVQAQILDVLRTARD